MSVAWGIALVVLGLLAWLGQTLSWLAPALAARLGMTETESAVEPTFWADIRAEATWDSLTLWTLPLAGVLLIADAATWAQWGLIGGAVYFYFGGRGVLSRIQIRKRGLHIGTEAETRSAFVMLPIWALAGLITIVAALNTI
jgi:hypothetical protein